jgi:predicted transcriptional regulator
MKTDYITSTPTLPPHLVYPRFLLGMDLRLITKEVYCILLDMVLNGEASVDKHGRRYLTFINPEIAKLIDRTPSTVGHALAELEAVGLVKRRWVSRCQTQPYHTYIKLPAGEDAP